MKSLLGLLIVILIVGAGCTTTGNTTPSRTPNDTITADFDWLFEIPQKSVANWKTYDGELGEFKYNLVNWNIIENTKTNFTLFHKNPYLPEEERYKAYVTKDTAKGKTPFVDWVRKTVTMAKDVDLTYSVREIGPYTVYITDSIPGRGPHLSMSFTTDEITYTTFKLFPFSNTGVIRNIYVDDFMTIVRTLK